MIQVNLLPAFPALQPSHVTKRAINLRVHRRWPALTRYESPVVLEQHVAQGDLDHIGGEETTGTSVLT